MVGTHNAFSVLEPRICNVTTANTKLEQLLVTAKADKHNFGIALIQGMFQGMN